MSKRILIILLFFYFFDAIVAACTPSAGDSWFRTSLVFDTAPLPNGVAVIQTTYEETPFVIKNASDEPFYIVGEYGLPQNFYEEDYPNSELPPTYFPRYKLVSNRVFYHFGEINFTDSAGWKQNTGGINNEAGYQLRLDESIIQIEGGSKNIQADDRPTNVTIPNPQSFKILAFHKGEPFEIKGILHYALNNKYDPKASAKGIEFCRKWSKTKEGSIYLNLILIAIIVIPIVFGGVMLSKRAFKKRS